MSTALLEAAESGDLDRVLALLPAMDRAARRSVVGRLTRAYKALDDAGRDGRIGNRRDATAIAALGCQTEPAATATFILRMRRVSPNVAYRCMSVLADRDPAWLGDLAHRLAASLRVPQAGRLYVDRENSDLFALVQELVRASGTAAPDGEAYAAAWGRSVWRYPREVARELAELRSDPHTPVLIPRLLELTGFGVQLDQNDWGGEIAALAESGHLDRGVLLDRAAGRLLTGGRPAEMRGFWTFLDALAPTEDELAAMTADWVRLTASADSPVAVRAQAILQRLSEAGRLDTGALAEASRDVLLRPEKVLVRAQLKMLAAALRRTPADAAELLPVIAVAFGHEDSALQQAAWKLVAPHVPPAGDPLRAELAEAATLLTPDLAARTGLIAAAASVVDALPPVSSPGRLAPAPATVVELAQEVAALVALRGDHAAPADRERVLDGLVRHAYRDREKLAAELRQVTRKRLPHDRIHEALAAVLDGTEPSTEPLRGVARCHGHSRCAICVFHAAWTVRVREAASAILTTPVPYLLATPAWENGAVDPDELLERLTGYARDGVRAGHADLDQALLRVRLPEPAGRARLSAAATALGTPDAVRYARWLDGGGITAGRTPELPPARLPALDDGFSEPFTLFGTGLGSGCHYHEERGPLPRWLAVLPVHREHLAAQINHYGDREEFWPDLPLLVEADGPAGLAVTTLVARAIAGATSRTVVSIVDAVLQLTARGEFDAAGCGALFADRRLAPDWQTVLGEVARAGAHATVWAVLSAALPALLAADERPHRFNAVLSLAADCAARSGATGAMPGLDALADSGGSSQTVKQARRLRDVLTG
ncbi:DUF6493 family protein [Catenuloplanes sp. NPDC051500]|uniref:DUF6493 family protein n=1 Tax=Catenuloplanes sp. NPDC051500 TaxID=3363959 RepID=UPI0037B673C8